jgi:D-3-phosphoglycerate dehydrogenase
MATDETPVVLRLNALTNPVRRQEREMLEAVGARIVEIEGETDEEILRHAAECDALMVVGAYVRTAVVEAMTRCKIISRMGTGTDKIDIPAATAKGIVVTNIPDFCTEEVADHTMALLLSAARRLDDFQRLARAGKPGTSAEFTVRRLSTCTLGIVGFGRIGKTFARRARAFGLKLLVADPYVTDEEIEAEGARRVGLDEMLPQADFLCLLCPLTPETRGMLGMEKLRRMKRGAVLINTSRGELADEDAIAQALSEGILGYAGIDVYGCVNVFSPDGFPTDHPLFHCERVTMTPHVAALSVEAMEEHRLRGTQPVVDVLAGRWPKNVVNLGVKPWFPIDVEPA